MHQLFVFSGCTYLHLGLCEALAGDDVQVIRVKTAEEVLEYPEGTGNRLLLVDAPKREPIVAARGKVFLWRWASIGGRHRNFPVLMYSDIGQGMAVYGAYSLSEQLSVSGLRAAILNAFKWPERFRRTACGGVPELSVRQHQVLFATLAGLSVRTTARMLDVHERLVLSTRTAVIDKLGLKNRVVLMSLNLKDFI
ncbi:TPA: hypothetical protein G8O00_000951 [Salmonella enterica]|uniref:HTH luxR-type domain-containing protein n=1 Tax=Salmonella enterica TaxID=28901 RepID=A0A747SQ19_SALER|nr:hypothetical protein [Salmonella enterica]HAF4697595.1 hypothetical protein [Salmonella enterica]